MYCNKKIMGLGTKEVRVQISSATYQLCVPEQVT